MYNKKECEGCILKSLKNGLASNVLSIFGALLQGLELQDIQHKKILLHRDVRSMIGQLNSLRHRDGKVHPRPSNDFDLTQKSKLFTSRVGSPNYLGDPDLLGKCDTFLAILRPINIRLINIIIYLILSHFFFCRRLTTGLKQVQATQIRRRHQVGFHIESMVLGHRRESQTKDRLVLERRHR